jgi:hypothetical protein
MGYFDILITFVPLLLLAYLSYFRIRSGRKKKFKPGTNEYELYQILHGRRFLVLTLIIASLSIVDLVFRYAIRTAEHPWAVYVLFVLQMTGSVAALFIIYKLYNAHKKDTTKKSE